MSKQIDVNELMTSTLKEASRAFVDQEYMTRKQDDALIPIRTRYEAYGKMAECFVNVNASMEGVKSGMRDCLKALTGMDTGFCNAAESTYTSLVDVIISVGEMAVQTLNCVYKISDLIAANPLPLVEMGEGVNDEDLPDAEAAEALDVAKADNDGEDEF